MEAYVRDAFLRHAPNLFDLVDIADGILDRDRDELFDFLGRRADVHRRDVSPAGRQCRQRLAVHDAHGQCPDHHRRNRHEIDEHGLADCEGWNAHGLLVGSVGGAAAGSTGTT